MRTALAIILALIASESASAAGRLTTHVPWSGCAQMKINTGRIEPYGDQDLKTLYCWLGLDNIDAGMEIARHYQRLSPPDYVNARKILLDLAKGTRQDSGSIEARGSVSGGGYSTERINSDGSVEEITYRPPSPVAQRELAKFYLLGKGVDKNIGNAMGWLKKAEKAGDIEAGVLRKALISKGYAKD